MSAPRLGVLISVSTPLEVSSASVQLGTGWTWTGSLAEVRVHSELKGEYILAKWTEYLAEPARCCMRLQQNFAFWRS